MTAVGFEGGQEPEGIAITTKTRDQIQTQVEEAISAAAALEERTGDKVRVLTAGRPSQRARLQSRREGSRSMMAAFWAAFVWNPSSPSHYSY